MSPRYEGKPTCSHGDIERDGHDARERAHVQGLAQLLGGVPTVLTEQLPDGVSKVAVSSRSSWLVEQAG